MKVGDKVVCVSYYTRDNISRYEPTIYDYRGIMPKLGTVHVIRGFIVDPLGQLGLQFIGSTVIHLNTGLEVGYHSDCFRKLDELKETNKQSRTEHDSDH